MHGMGIGGGPSADPIFRQGNSQSFGPSAWLSNDHIAMPVSSSAAERISFVPPFLRIVAGFLHIGRLSRLDRFKPDIDQYEPGSRCQRCRERSTPKCLRVKGYKAQLKNGHGVNVARRQNNAVERELLCRPAKSLSRSRRCSMKPIASREQPRYLPAQEEIEAQCEAIRRGWSRRTARNRGPGARRVQIPEINATQFHYRRKPLP
jgi:hypothetical protein